jgi:hypothetical protein
MEIRTISPEVAKVLLEKNTLNRSINDNLVNHYARQMATGNWKLNGETIIIADTGRLLEGQHRLWACIKANTPFATYVVEGVDENVFDTINTGKSRSNKDILSILGFSNAARLAAAVRWYKNLSAGMFVTGGAKVKMAAFELEEIISSHPRLIEIVNTVINGSFIRELLPSGVTAALIYLFEQVDEERAKEWVHQLQTGEGLSEGNAVLALRSRIVTYAARRQKGAYDNLEYYSFMVNSWNAFFNGETVQVVRGSTTMSDGTRVYPKIKNLKVEKKVA